MNLVKTSDGISHISSFGLIIKALIISTVYVGATCSIRTIRVLIVLEVSLEMFE